MSKIPLSKSPFTARYSLGPNFPAENQNTIIRFVYTSFEFWHIQQNHYKVKIHMCQNSKKIFESKKRTRLRRLFKPRCAVQFKTLQIRQSTGELLFFDQ